MVSIKQYLLMLSLLAVASLCVVKKADAARYRNYSNDYAYGDYDGYYYDDGYYNDYDDDYYDDRGRTARGVFGGAATGALIGGLTGGGRGAAIGAGVGGLFGGLSSRR